MADNEDWTISEEEADNYSEYLDSSLDYTMPDDYEEPEGPDDGIYDDGGGINPEYRPYLPPEPTLAEHPPNDPITTTGHFNPQVQYWGDTVYYAWLGTCERGTSSPQIWMAQTDDEGNDWKVRQITTGHGKSSLNFKISETGLMHFFWNQGRCDDGYPRRTNNSACYTGWCEINDEEGIFGIEDLHIKQRTNFPDFDRIRGTGYNFHGTYGLHTMDVQFDLPMYAGIGMGREARSLIHQGNIVALNAYCSYNDEWCLSGTGFHIGGDFLGGPDEFNWRSASWPGWGIWLCITKYDPKKLTIWGGFTYPRGICFNSLRTTNTNYKSNLSVSICFGLAYYSWKARELFPSDYDGNIGPGKIVTARMGIADYFEKWHIVEEFEGVKSSIKCLDQGVYCSYGCVSCKRTYSEDDEILY